MQLEGALRASKRQAAPFSKGAKEKPRRPGRRPGREYGPRARRPIPLHVDETIEVPFPPCCPCCSGKVEEEKVADQYQTDIPKVTPHVTHFRIHCGRCVDCKKPVRGRHPRQTSTAVGAAASQLGPRSIALAADLNKRLGVPYEKITSLYQTAFGLSVSRAGLCLALHRLARVAEPTYHELIGRVRQAPVVAPDETGWKVAGRLAWLWAFVTAEATVYAIQPGRGFDEAAEILGEFTGVLERDGWAPYRRFTEAEHQSCLAHLLRRCHTLLEFAQRGQARFPHAVRHILLASLHLQERVEVGAISLHGLAVARGKLEARLDRTLDGRITHPPNRRFLRHLTTEREHLFTFLGREDIEPTNWRAEHAIRPAVVTRKVCGGNRSWAGAQTQQILASVLRTCRQQQRDPLGLFATMLLRGRHPPLLRPPP
jgi:transposase